MGARVPVVAAPAPVEEQEAAIVQYKVIGSLAVIRKDKHERYINRGGVFGADVIDEANAEHLLAVGLIEVFEQPAEAE
jgi:hypothetical protein